MRIFYPFLLIIQTIMLSACHSSMLIDLLTQPGGILYEDGFSDSSNGWTQASSLVGSMDYYHGAFRIFVNSVDYDLWSVTGNAFKDVQVEAEAGRLAGPSENRYGLICRYKNAQNFYFFVISSDGYFAIGKTSNGKQILLGQTMMAYSSAIVTGMGPNHLRIDCVGNWLTLYINNQPIAEVQDTEFTSGDVGMLAGAFDVPGVDVIFDNFIVLKP